MVTRHVQHARLRGRSTTVWRALIATTIIPAIVCLPFALWEGPPFGATTSIFDTARVILSHFASFYLLAVAFGAPSLVMAFTAWVVLHARQWDHPVTAACVGLVAGVVAGLFWVLIGFGVLYPAIVTLFVLGGPVIGLLVWAIAYFGRPARPVRLRAPRQSR